MQSIIEKILVYIYIYIYIYIYNIYIKVYGSYQLTWGVKGGPNVAVLLNSA